MPRQLFGRDDELARLRVAADPGLLAVPRFVVVEGEPGIGKTSLVQALADSTPARVRWAQGAEDGAPPFWLWRQLTPEIQPDPGGDRFTLLAALRDTVAADRGCLLVVDDVQWADEPSLLALRGLLRDPGCRGLVCCATRRTGEAGPGWEQVGPDLLSGSDVERLTLGGLDDAAVAAVLEAAAGRSLDPGELSFPFTRGPRKERGPFGFHPGLRTPQLPATHAREGTGLRARTGDHVTIGASTT
jgi:hypothetical protein